MYFSSLFDLMKWLENRFFFPDFPVSYFKIHPLIYLLGVMT